MSVKKTQAFEVFAFVMTLAQILMCAGLVWSCAGDVVTGKPATNQFATVTLWPPAKAKPPAGEFSFWVPRLPTAEITKIMGPWVQITHLDEFDNFTVLVKAVDGAVWLCNYNPTNKVTALQIFAGCE